MKHEDEETLDPAFEAMLASLSPEEASEARRMAAIAARAERRAKERERTTTGEESTPGVPTGPKEAKMVQNVAAEASVEFSALFYAKDAVPRPASSATPTERPKFMTKAQREAQALERLNEKRRQEKARKTKLEEDARSFATSKAEADRRQKEADRAVQRKKDELRRQQEAEFGRERGEAEVELKAIRESYLGRDRESIAAEQARKV